MKIKEGGGMDVQDKAFREWFAQYENNIEYASEKIAWDAWQAAKAQADQKIKLLLCDEHLKKCESPTGVFNSQYSDEEPCLICLAKQAKAQAVPKWISVEDKLPELKEHTWRTALPVNVMIDGYGQYLCYPCQDGNGVFYWADATYYGNDKGEHPIKCDRDTEVLNVTHWMPLPDAPQEPAND